MTDETDETTTETTVIETYINVSAAQEEAVTPLCHHDSHKFRPWPAFIQLDTYAGEISYVMRRNRNSVPNIEYSYGSIRWQLSTLIHGSQLVPLAEWLQPLMQQIQNDISHSPGWDEDEVINPDVFMGVDARAASDKIICLIEHRSGFIDLADPSQVSEVRTVGDFVDAPADGLTATT